MITMIAVRDAGNCAVDFTDLQTTGPVHLTLLAPWIERRRSNYVTLIHLTHKCTQWLLKFGRTGMCSMFCAYQLRMYRTYGAWHAYVPRTQGFRRGLACAAPTASRQTCNRHD